MKEYKVKLSSIEDVNSFVNAANSFDFEIDLISGRFVVNGKSLMMIFALDHSEPIIMRVHADDTKKLEEDMKQFIVE